MKIPEPKRTSSGGWRIQLRLNGVSVPVTASTRKECIRQAELIKAEHRSGRRGAQALKSEATLRGVCNAYISRNRAGLRQSTLRGYKNIVRLRFQGIMDKPASKISDWQGAVDYELERLSPKSVRNAWSFVAKAYKDYFNLPAPEVKLAKAVKQEPVYLEPDEIKRFVELVKGDKCCIPALLALSSLRCSEICALTWDNVDLKADRLLVSGAAVYGENNKLVFDKANKNGSSHRYVPIFIPELHDALEAVEDKQGYVVPCRPNTVYRQINKFCASHGFPKLGVHKLRHSFASLCYYLDIPVKVAQQIGGWSDYNTMLKIYTHISQKHIGEKTDILRDFFT